MYFYVVIIKINLGSNYNNTEVCNLEINQRGKGLILTSPGGKIKRLSIIKEILN